MSGSRFADGLKKINSFQNVVKSAEISESFKGGWSTVNFHQVSGITFTIINNEEQPPLVQTAELQVAISKLKDANELYKSATQEQHRSAAEDKGLEYDERADIVKTPDPLTLENSDYWLEVKKTDILRSMKTLANSHVPTRFNLQYLAYSENAEKIAFKGLDDLYNFIYKSYNENQDKLNLQTIRRFVGQMLLGISDLHLRDLIHRDIKLENFFLFNYGGNNLFVKLGDHSETLKSSQRKFNRVIPATVNHLAPELEACGNNVAHYNSLNWKAIDCWALGLSIEQILEKVFYFKENTDYTVDREVVYHSLREGMENRKLIALIAGLLNKNPAQRTTIFQAMQNTFFGADEETRKTFFNTLIAEEKKIQLKIDGCNLNHFYPTAAEDYYILLDIRIKNLITRGERVTEEIKEYNKKLTPSVECIKNQNARLQLTEQEINILINILNPLIEERSYKDDLINLRTIATEELGEIKLKKEKLKIFTLLYVISETLTQCNTGFRYALGFFYQAAEINLFKQFHAGLQAESDKGMNYPEHIEAICTHLGEEKAIPVGSIKEKLHSNLIKILGKSIYVIKAEQNIPAMENPRTLAA